MNSRIKPGSWTASNEITLHTSATFMGYLHGDVAKDEAELACAYEYARESGGLWKAAKRRDCILRKYPNTDCEKLVLWILQQGAIGGRTHPMWEWRFLMCKSFPMKDWNALLPGEGNFESLPNTARSTVTDA